MYKITSYDYNNYIDTEINLSNPVISTHLLWELDIDFFYFVTTGQLKIYLKQISTGTETEIDIDPGNASGDNKSRIQLIQSGYHDRANSIIWFVDCDNDASADEFVVWKLDYTASKTAPTITEISVSVGADVNTVYAWDIFKIGSNVYVINSESRTAVGKTVVWDVDTDPFVEKDVYSGLAVITYLGIVSGTDYYTFGSTSPANTVRFVHYDSSIDTLIVGDQAGGSSTYSVFGINSQLLGIAYDDSNILYFTSYEPIGEVFYLTSYSISGSSYTVLGLYDIVLMLNRNTNSANDPPFNLEKGFHLTEDKVYQIPLTYTGTLNLISVFNFLDTIIAITDHLLFDNSNNIYQMSNLIGSIFEGYIFTSRNYFPYLEMKFNSDDITIIPQMLIQIIGSHTVDGSTTTGKVVFEGIAVKPTEGRIQFVLVENQGSEMEYISPRGNKSGRTDEIITDINDDGAPDGTTYIRDGTLAEGKAMGTLDLSGAKIYRTVLNDLAEHDIFLWSLRPQGDLDYNDGSIDSGADIRNDIDVSNDVILQLQGWTIAKLNQIIVNGAINPTTGTPYTGQWDDEEDQQANNINGITIEDAQLNTDALCQAKSDDMGANESVRTRARFKFRKTEYGLIQVGQTITFKYDITNYITIAEAQFILDKFIMNIKTEVGYAEISSGL